jgi:hypothetical protein
MDWNNVLKVLCPNKALQECQDDLTQCEVDLSKCNNDKLMLDKQLDTETANYIAARDERDDYKMLLENSNANIASLQKQYNDLTDLQKLLTEGPPIPDQGKVRWLQASYIEAVLSEGLGPAFDNLPFEKRFWSDSDYLVCPRESIQLFLDYYTMFWLPNINPYTVTKWTKLNGTTVDIWALDCDDFADFLKGLPAINPKWSCFPWGIMWGQVEGLFIAGGHAFDFVVCCTDEYKEESPSLTPTKGLKLYIIEPQAGQQWSVNTPVGMIVRAAITGYQLKEVKGFFNVKEVWMTMV